MKITMMNFKFSQISDNIYLHVCACTNRDRESVLKEDRDALKAVQKHQPHLSDDQKKELTQVHPWIQTGCLPKAINVTVRSSSQKLNS